MNWTKKDVMLSAIMECSNFDRWYCLSNTETPKKEKKTYTVEEIAEQLCVSKKVAYALVKSGQLFAKSPMVRIQ